MNLHVSRQCIFSIKWSGTDIAVVSSISRRVNIDSCHCANLPHPISQTGEDRKKRPKNWKTWEAPGQGWARESGEKRCLQTRSASAQSWLHTAGVKCMAALATRRTRGSSQRSIDTDMEGLQARSESLQELLDLTNPFDFYEPPNTRTDQGRPSKTSLPLSSDLLLTARSAKAGYPSTLCRMGR